MMGPFVAVGLGTGMRRGEIEAVVWGEGGLDLARGEVLVAASWDRGVSGPPKSGNQRRVPIGMELSTRLRRYRLAAGHPADGRRVFASSHRRAWEQIREAAGIPKLRVHDLRHTCATFLLAAGLKSHEVAELLGHADAGLVDRLYVHALPSEVSSAADRLESWRAAQTGTT